MLPFRGNHCAVFQKILRTIMKHGKYCETCAIIETFGKHVKYENMSNIEK